MQTAIKAIAYHLPAQVLTNSALEAAFPEWPAVKIEEKTGIAADGPKLLTGPFFLY